jgi:hypothetical protein
LVKLFAPLAMNAIQRLSGDHAIAPPESSDPGTAAFARHRVALAGSADAAAVAGADDIADVADVADGADAADVVDVADGSVGVGAGAGSVTTQSSRPARRKATRSPFGASDGL